jgi:hypothetical protein
LTPTKRLKLYSNHPQGEINASVAGAFIHAKKSFYVIRPGYDAQGRRRENWTQIVFEDVPIWEWKLEAPMSDVIAKFKSLWKSEIGLGGDSRVLANKSLRMTLTARRASFRDGTSGESPAVSLTRDGRGQGTRLTS